jgi:AraC-like DNA-binding protein
MVYSPHIDLFAIIILLGVIQGAYLGLFFINRRGKTSISYHFLGLLMISLSLIILEIFLNYTGYIVEVISFNNFSEAFGFTIAPLLFLYIKSTIKEKWQTIDLFHFLPFIFWIFYSIPDYLQSDAFKYNCYLDVYHPELERLNVIVKMNPDPLGLRTYVTQLVILQLLIYLVISSIEVVKIFRSRNISLLGKSRSSLHSLRNLTVLIIISTLMLIVVKMIFFKDQGDHLLASFIALVIYITSFTQIRRSTIESGLGRKQSVKKYARSSLADEDKEAISMELNTLMIDEKKYADNLVSLPSIAKLLQIHPHHLSQVINEKRGQSFFEMIAEFRIEAAKDLLRDPDKSHLTIEEISEVVGYNSKSAFNKAFKSFTGQTPSEYKA